VKPIKAVSRNLVSSRGLRLRPPVVKLSELDRLVDAEILQEHTEHCEPLTLAGEDPIHKLDFLWRFVQPFVELFMRPPASFTADNPVDRFHRIAPRINPYSNQDFSIVLSLTSGFN
jgi:hypothetical protein